jgi:hypothetical protein
MASAYLLITVGGTWRRRNSRWEKSLGYAASDGASHTLYDEQVCFFDDTAFEEVVFRAVVSDRSVLFLLKRREGSMSTHEDRIAALERKMTTLELKRLYDERKAAENTPSEQAYNYSEINHNLTMLLGIASGQEHAIRLMQGDLGIIRDRITSLEEKFEQRFTSLEGKFEQVLQHLAALTTKLE